MVILKFREIEYVNHLVILQSKNNATINAYQKIDQFINDNKNDIGQRYEIGTN